MKHHRLNIFLMDDQGIEHLVATYVYVATSFEDRKQGLIGMEELPQHYGMLLYPVSAIHMRGVHFPIDVIYMDKSMQVVRTVKHINPEETDIGHSKAYFVLELPAGSIHFNPVSMRIVVRI